MFRFVMSGTPPTNRSSRRTRWSINDLRHAGEPENEAPALHFWRLKETHMTTTIRTPRVKVSFWDIDPAHTLVQFGVRHMMISTVRGHFTTVGGTVQVDEH